MSADALDEKGVEWNVVVEEQEVGIEVAAVGEAAFALAPAAIFVELVDPDRSIRVDNPHPGGVAEPSEGGEVLGLGEIIVVEEGQPFSAGRLDAGVGSGRASPVFGQIDPHHRQGKVIGNLGRCTAVVDHHHLEPAVSVGRDARECLRQKLGPVLGANHDAEPRPLADLVQLRHAAEPSNESGLAVGHEIADGDPTIAFGSLDRWRQRGGAKVAHGHSGVEVVVEFELAGVGLEWRV